MTKRELPALRAQLAAERRRMREAAAQVQASDRIRPLADGSAEFAEAVEDALDTLLDALSA
jgi:uncharacterized protein involved in exopolysaccharide biosynthesis